MALTPREMPGMGMGLMDMDLSIGVLLLCVMFAAIFFGVLTVQCSVYWDRYKNDAWGIKAMVASVWLLELLHQLFAAMWIYQLGIDEAGNIMFMMAPGWRIGGASVFMSLTAFIVQVFYARRGWILNKSLWPLSLISIILALLALGSGLAAGIELIRLPHFGDFMAYRWLQEIWFSSEAATDLLVALIVVYSLRGARTGYSSTERGVWALITYTFSTGLTTSAFAFTVIALFKTLPNTFTHPGLSIILARIYSNSLLTSLNLRGTWIKDKKTPQSTNPSEPTRYVGTKASPKHLDWADSFPPSRPTMTDSQGLQLSPLTTFQSFTHTRQDESFMGLDDEDMYRSQMSSVPGPSEEIVVIGRPPLPSEIVSARDVQNIV